MVLREAIITWENEETQKHGFLTGERWFIIGKPTIRTKIITEGRVDISLRPAEMRNNKYTKRKETKKQKEITNACRQERPSALEIQKNRSEKGKKKKEKNIGRKYENSKVHIRMQSICRRPLLFPRCLWSP